ncbi:Trp biosynthesis-associated membrane protein [Sinomonas sp. ASV322]|uniref:Trp biosynthesis-associated membrane protein n=1 Tax=Sinomonas sp. ASV322 TaxID=3041920 RepID=UPI0027DB295E|nr:Trp biosynthesis-associated membrane protein [Sinomonas sp. ASV322]MDQ4500925.1 Trp biosynthesis-associated membrane protein [Sinomonas sp. ASV322]
MAEPGRKPDGTTAGHEPRRVAAWARKSTVVALSVLVAIVAFATTTQTWIDADVQGAAVRTAHVAVQGSKAATAVTALALVGLAGVLAAAVAGRIGRAVASVVVVLAGLGVAAACLAVIADPRGAADSSIATATGASGAPATTALTWFPAAAAVAGLLLALCGLLALLASRRWPTRTKYDAGRRRDPNAQTAGSADGERAGDQTNAPAGRVDDIDGWDRLTRGEDPTA